jgi:protein O-GlcNAc transferase
MEVLDAAQSVAKGFVHLQRRQLAQAQACFAHALRCAPDSAEALVGITSVLLQLGQPRQAQLFAEQAARAHPTVPEVQANVSAVYLALKRPKDALGCAERALRLRSSFFEAQFNRAEALLALGEPESAIAAYRQALALRPELAPALCGCAHAYRETGQLAAARASYAQALAVQPDYAAARVGRLLATTPVMLDAAEDTERSRIAFRSEIAALEHWVSTREGLDELTLVGISQPFYLAYQEQPNKELLMRWGALSTHLMQRWAARQPFSSAVAATTDSRVRLGIVTAHLREHSVYRALIKGWLEQLDRSRVRLSVFHTGAADAANRISAAGADLIECAELSLRECCNAIRARELDVLLYPEIGMDPLTLQLASLRLARHQIASWGHPETTGLPTIDYYLSAAAFEPAGAEQNYSERLVTLPNLGCFYEPLDTPPAELHLERLGIGVGSALLLCAGMPYKYGPQYDAILIEIARQLPHCRFVFFQARPRSLSDKLQQRLRAQFAASGLDPDRYLTTVPWLSSVDFFGLMQRSDVLLDTLGFSGFNTTMQALECALPVVAYEGRFMRGRFASGILRTAGLPELVATNKHEYVQRVVRLVSDSAYGAQVRARLVAARSALYRDGTVIAALMSFLSGIAQKR